MLHRISAGAIVEDRGRLLLVHHVRAGHYDFWVCPGGGVKDFESLEEAATREVKEETGLDVAISRLLYIEELANPSCRYVKFWFLGSHRGGTIDITHPDTVQEYIVEAAWVSTAELQGKTVFPPMVQERLSADLASGSALPVRLPLRQMQFW